LSKTDVIRQGLRLGIPKVLESFKESARRRRPACLDYLEDYPLAAVTARDSETALRKKLRRHAPSYR
ncbi:MAG: hypothetical protein RMK20_16020, partial [Verrucomicrobiales bacterium]|nr:hypothetical protein [Verrucomicrobiales bacterium]